MKNIFHTTVEPKMQTVSTDGEWMYILGHGWHSKLNGRLHNSLGPAVILDSGYKAWYVDGKLHRLDGPAAVCTDGQKEWRVNGKLHRLDGPAFECADGYKERWVDGFWASEEDFALAVISFLLGVNKKTAKIIEREMKK